MTERDVKSDPCYINWKKELDGKLNEMWNILQELQAYNRDMIREREAEENKRKQAGIENAKNAVMFFEIASGILAGLGALGICCCFYRRYTRRRRRNRKYSLTVLLL